jgi:hypothetical protein
MNNEIALFNEIKELEYTLLNPAARKSAAILTDILSDDFIEFGSSGKTYNKQQSIDALQNEAAEAIDITNFQIRCVAPTTILATYIAVKGNKTDYPQSSLRSSLWVSKNGKRQIIFHQGTNINRADNS